jgi:hypothetical protein
LRNVLNVFVELATDGRLLLTLRGNVWNQLAQPSAVPARDRR